MDAALTKRIERGVDRVAAALFAAACAYAAFRWLGSSLSSPLIAQAGGVGAVAYLLGFGMLSAVQPERERLPVPVFDVRDIEPEAPSELLLTELLEPAEEVAEEPLVLDDVLAELAPDSRVVRLFDATAMPTPGQLNARIETHLSASDRREPPECPDASQALHDALAQLRRSLG